MSFEDKKILAIKLITVFSNRMKWGIFSKSIKSKDFPTAANYNKLIDKLNDLDDSVGGNYIVDVICKLISRLEEHVVSGEKAVRLARVLPDDISDFNKHVDAVFVKIKKQSTNLSSGNWLLDESPSIGVEDTPKLVTALQLGDNIVWVFNSTRETTIKEQIPPSAIAKAFNGYNTEDGQFFLVRKIVRKCYDIVFYDKNNGAVEFRIDNPYDFSTSERSHAFHMLEVAFDAYCVGEIGKRIRTETVELFRAINSLYEIPVNDGRVVELSFITDEGGIKNSKTRFNDGCILLEEFHKSGCKGINNQLTPYKIARVWPFKNTEYSSEPELMLPGSLKMASQTVGKDIVLDEFLVTKSVGHSDYNMIVDKLRSILNIEQRENGHSNAA